MRTTAQQAQIVCALAGGNSSGTTLRKRVREALADIDDETWVSAFCDLLIVLGDGEPEGARPDAVAPEQMDAMRRNSSAATNEERIRSRMARLRALYDWPALKAVIAACPKNERGIVGLPDLFNILDMHDRSGHGFRVGTRNRPDDFLTPDRVRGARDALKLILQAMFYVSWQHCRQNRKVDLQRHYEFAKMLGRRMQRQGRELAQGGVAFDDQDFYLGDVAFASMNYDPIALWMQFLANRELNNMATVPHVGCPALRLQLFHDLGHFVGGPRIAKRGQRPFYPMNESAAQRLNDADHGAKDRIRITKFLFPHGCLWWRECPDCGKLSSYMGDEWRSDSPTLIPPPPLQAFVLPDTFQRRKGAEENAWNEGELDARACVHCGTLTSAYDAQLVMQSNFKRSPPPFIEEIERDLRVVVQRADHIVFMGYSLPRDDVEYRAFFAARRQRVNSRLVKCSVVIGQHADYCKWRPFSEVKLSNLGTGEGSTLRAASEIFGKENVYFYGGGIPEVFMENGQVTMSAVERLLSREKRP